MASPAASLPPAQRKIYLLHNTYFKEPISKQYWSRGARDTMLEIIDAAQIDVPKDVRDDLCSKCSNWLHVNSRRNIAKEVMRCWDKKAVTSRNEEPVSSPVAVDRSTSPWPEIESVEDLTTYPFWPTLRDDVKKWIQIEISSRAEGGVLFSSYEPQRAKPVVLYTTTEEKALLLNDLLQVKSGDLSIVTEVPSRVCEAICFKKHSKRPPGSLQSRSCEEACAINGGTIGAWITAKSEDNDGNVTVQRLGITCDHVVKSLGDGVKRVARVSGVESTPRGQDIAVVEVRPCSACTATPCAQLNKSTVPPKENCKCPCHPVATMPTNALHFISPDSTEVEQPAVGELVYKCGQTTGMTVGRLLSLDAQPSEEMFSKAYPTTVLVNWVVDEKDNNQLPFAVGGDCGALYAVKRDRGYLPFAIHVNSNPEMGLSVGLPLLSNLDFVLGQYEWQFITSDAVAAVNEMRLKALHQLS